MIVGEGIVEQIEVKRINFTSLLVRPDNASTKQNTSIRELVLSIKEHGLIQPITVRPTNSGFEVVAGHRRLKACKLLRWKRIPCTVRSLSDKAAFEIQLVENIQRESLDPIEEAESFKKYVLDYGWGGVSYLARVISKSEQYVSGRIQILRLPEGILSEIAQKNLSVSHAMELVNLDENDQQAMTNAVINKSLTVRGLREMIRPNRDQEYQEHFDHSPSSESRVTAKKIKMFKKSLTILRMSLANMDSLINEVNNTLSSEEKVDLVRALMAYRLQIHSMIDECLRSTSELKRKL